MGLANFSELKASIADTLDRDDLVGQIDDFITLAEARHKRDIKTRGMIIRAQVALDDTAVVGRFLALPTGFLRMQVFRLLQNAAGEDLRDNIINEVNLHELTRLRLPEVGRPRFFTIHEEIEFDVVPDQAYTAEMVYYAELTPLSDANPVNPLLTRAPDVYLYGALAASAPFLMHDERLAVWGDLYGLSMDSLNLAELNARHGGPLVARIDGTTP